MSAKGLIAFAGTGLVAMVGLAVAFASRAKARADALVYGGTLRLQIKVSAWPKDAPQSAADALAQKLVAAVPIDGGDEGCGLPTIVPSRSGGSAFSPLTTSNALRVKATAGDSGGSAFSAVGHELTIEADFDARWTHERTGKIRDSARACLLERLKAIESHVSSVTGERLNSKKLGN